MPIEIFGLKDLKAQLRATEGASVREITSQLKVGAKVITAAAKGNIHDKTGNLAADAKPYATVKSAGVRFTLPYAAVQEFAGTWIRKNRGQGGGPVNKGMKKHHFAGHPVGGTNEVHYTTPTPRFAYKAIDNLGPGLIQATFDDLVNNVLKAHGWFEG